MTRTASTIMESELISLARAYVALSNSHRLEFIIPMFDQHASYHSAYVGEFKGRDNIANMMADFFERYFDVYWHVEEYQSLGDASIGFNFIMTATYPQVGEPVRRSAYEKLKFNQQGYIELLQIKEP